MKQGSKALSPSESSAPSQARAPRHSRPTCRPSITSEYQVVILEVGGAAQG